MNSVMPPRLGLQVPQDAQVPGHVLGPLDVAEEDRRGAADAHLVGGADDLDPAGGREFGRAYLAAHLVHQDLGRRAAEAAVTGREQFLERAADREAGPLGVPLDLHRAEGVDVDVRVRRMDGGEDLQDLVEGDGRVQAAHHADLVDAGRAAGEFHGLGGA